LYKATLGKESSRAV